jgi:TonB family protein
MVMEPVTDVLLNRSREPAGIRTMLGVSVAIHVVVALVLILMPGTLGMRAEEMPKTVMTISLGGAPGPRTGGRNPLGGRPIQTTAPMPPPLRPQPLQPPAARTPAMTVPAPSARATPKRAAPTPPVKEAPDEARGQKPIFGEQEQFGSAVAETAGVGFGGLTTGGGGASGYLDVGNFCCPDYLSTMQRLILGNWNSRQQVAAAVMIKFSIQRDGRITDVTVEKSSGYTVLDMNAQRALMVTRLPALPPAFPDNVLTVHLIFEYQR